MSNTILELVDFSVEIENAPIIERISFKIEREQTFALVGESGSGKSITALGIMQLLPELAKVSAGKINFATANGNRDLLKLNNRQMRQLRALELGMVFQEPMTALNPVFSVQSQLYEALKCANSKRQQLRYKAIEILEQVGLGEQNLAQYPHQLSGGMRQRVMIACALASRPQLLIMDEPTTALDASVETQVLKLVKDLQQQMGMAVLFISHDLKVVGEVADKVAVMQNGAIVEHNSVAKLYAKPSHPYTQKLFTVLPSLDKRGRYLSSGKSLAAQPNIKLCAEQTPASQSQALLEVKNLSLSYQQPKLWQKILRQPLPNVVKKLSFELEKGQTLALVGESGSGKSTVARALLGLLPAQSGSIEYLGKSIADFNQAAIKNYHAAVQIVFQDPYSAMNPRMTVAEIIEEGMRSLLAKKTAAQYREISANLLEQVGLNAAMLKRYPHQFSGGQRQRIVIARALAVKPKILILDEPTSSLDVSVQAQILDLLQDLQASLELSYLFISHNMAVVSYLADRLMVMQNGRLIESNATLELVNNPQHSYTKTLLANTLHLKSPI